MNEATSSLTRAGLSARADNPVLAWLIKKIARNHVRNGNLVLSIIVPAVSEVWCRQLRH